MDYNIIHKLETIEYYGNFTKSLFSNLKVKLLDRGSTPLMKTRINDENKTNVIALPMYVTIKHYYLQMLASQAKKSIGKHEFMSVLAIFPVVKHLRSIKPDMDFTLEVLTY